MIQVFYRFFMVSVGVFLFSGGAQAEDLTRAEKSRVLRAIDSVCADTWCEGDYDFRFDSIRCELTRRICKMNFRAGIRTESRPTPRWTVKSYCTLTEVAGLSDLIQSQGSDELRERAYEEINGCIDYRLRESEQPEGS